MKNEGKGGMAVIIGMGKPEKEGVEFDAPEGFDYSDMKEGEEKEVLAKVCYCGDGEFTLVSIDGYPLAEEEEEEMEEEEMPEGEEEETEVEEEVPFQERLRQRAGLTQ
jgi:hypothetical protein